MAVLNPDSRPTPALTNGDPSLAYRETLVTCPYFSLERLNLITNTSFTCDPAGGPQVFTCLEGSLRLSVSAGSVALRGGQTVITLAPAGPAPLSARNHAVILRGWLGDL